IVIPEAQNSESLRREPSGSLLILFDRPCMLTTIDLDDQPRLQAGKIEDVGAHRNLAPEAKPFHLLVAEPHPQSLLGIGHCGPEPPSALNLRARGHLEARSDSGLRCTAHPSRMRTPASELPGTPGSYRLRRTRRSPAL